MSDKSKISAALSVAFELAVDANGEVTTEAHLLPAGSFRAVDGRPHECQAWQMDARIAAQVIERTSANQNDILVDYEHQSLRAEYNGQPVIAAGWFNSAALDWRDNGLYAINIAWTEAAKKRIADKEIRYISAVFTYYAETGEVLEIISVAVTNTPALDGLDALSALNKKINQPTNKPTGANDMDPAQIAALTIERDTLKASTAALTAENTEIKTKIAALVADNDALAAKVQAAEAEKAALTQAAEAEKKDALIKCALTDGKLVPALKEWASKKSLADLTEYLGAVDPLRINQQQHNKDGDTGTAGLTTEELAMCTKMNVAPADYLKNKEVK